MASRRIEDAALNPVVCSYANEKIKYTEVVVIGNGPSGISLSFLLSGNWPYYSGAPHPDEYLQIRLKDDDSKSLIEQDLEFLSSGLEGRSANPVALLFDAVTHPDADMGIENKSLLNWVFKPEQAIPHVVLGKAGEGGAWQMMEGVVQTLSLGTWMQLPDMPFKQWLVEHRRKLEFSEVSSKLRQDRASVDDVRQYYTDYVKEKNLGANFHRYTTVTSVERVLDVHHSVDDESGEQIPCSANHTGKHKWEVRGYEVVTGENGESSTEDFCYRAPNVVLATGTFDLPNRLRIPGEHYPHVLHSLRDVEDLILSGKLTPESDPLLVIGAGLSAGDAILAAREYNIPVVHVFRRDTEDPLIIYKKLPKKLYPEYHSVHNMMRQREMDGYCAYPMHHVVEVKEDGNVLLRAPTTSCDTMVQASYVLVQIGSRPCLSFMPHSGKNLGIVPDVHIDCKHNPIDVDPYTYQSMHECGLFAMGPLVGDNFVRFLRGGALGITNHLWRKRNNNL